MKKMNRRTLIRWSVAVAMGFAGLPFIFKSVARAATPSVGSRITVGCIGIGWQGGGEYGFLPERKRCAGRGFSNRSVGAQNNGTCSKDTAYYGVAKMSDLRAESGKPHFMSESALKPD